MSKINRLLQQEGGADHFHNSRVLVADRIAVGIEPVHCRGIGQRAGDNSRHGGEKLTAGFQRANLDIGDTECGSAERE